MRPSSPPAGLSADQADEVASKYRASWEPPPPADGFDAEGDTEIDAGKASPGRAEPTELMPHADPTLPTRGTRRPLLLAGAGALAVLTGLAISLANSAEPDLSPSPGSEPSATTTEAAAPEPASQPTTQAETPAPAPDPAAQEPESLGDPTEADQQEAAAASTEAPAPPPAPAMAQLTVRTVPRGARLTLDGATVRNPLDRALLQGSTHLLVASAPGFQQTRRRVEVAADMSVTLQLRRVRPRAQRAKRPRTKTRMTRMTRTTMTRTTMARTTMARTGGAGFVSDNPY